MKLSQRDRILYELRQAGEAGVRSDRWFALSMPRAAARIQELRDSGVEITSEREGKYVRYRIVGEGAAKSPGSASEGEPGLQTVSDLLSGDDSGPRATRSGSGPASARSEPEQLRAFGGYEIQEAA